MIKTSANLRRIFALVLALAMVLSLAVSAVATENAGATPNADGKFTITIKPGENTATPGDDSLKGRFTAYAIFEGKLNDNVVGGYDQGDITDGNEQPKANQLTVTGWGSGVDAAGLVKALLEDTTVLVEAGNNGDPAAVTVASLFKKALVEAGYAVDESNGTLKKGDADVTISTDVDVAKAVAKVLSDANSSYSADLTRAFAKNAKANIEGSELKSTWDDDEWTIKVPSAGYYLILDNYVAGEDDNDEVSDYILAVFGNQTIKIKSKGATSEKIILDGDDEDYTVAGIGDTVKFQLKGTLPENYEKYSQFIYIFHDTLSTGLTFNEDSVVVTVKNAAGDVVVVNSDSYKVRTGDDILCEDDNCSFEIFFKDLKEIKDENDNDIKLDNTSEVYVTYTVTVNENAEASVVGEVAKEKNDMQLQYSNDPTYESDGKWDPDDPEDPEDPENPPPTSKTPKDTAFVFVLDAIVDKVDGTKESDNKLAGAGFSLSKEETTYEITNGSQIEYITEEEFNELFGEVDSWTGDLSSHKVTDNESEYKDYYPVANGENDGPNTKTETMVAVFTKSGTTYTIAGWVTETVANNAVTAEGDNWKWTDALTSKGTAVLGEGYDEGTYYLAFETVASGDLKVVGIGNGTYTLTEVVTPTGYVTMDPITFTVTATVDGEDEGEDPKLTEVSATLEEDRDDVDINDADESSTNKSLDVVLENMPEGYLPGTGGTGTALFYIGGAALLMLAVILLLILNRKPAKR